MIHHNALLYIIGSFIQVEQEFYLLPFFTIYLLPFFTILVIKRLKPVQCPFRRLIAVSLFCYI